MNLLTTTEVATSLGVTPRRVLALIQSGRLRAQKAGRDWLIKSADLDKVRERKAGRPSTPAAAEALGAAQKENEE
jgi:excisionase family DNA binding protein